MKPDALTAELLLAEMGLDRILAGKPRQLDDARQRAAMAKRKEIRTLILSFLSKAEREPIDDLPDFDYDKVSELLRKGGAEKNIAALYAAMPDRDHELGSAIAGTATPIVSLLREVLPRQVRKTVAGVVVSPGSDTDVAKFARTWSVALDPLICLRDLREGCLTEDMVKAWEHFYPAMLRYAKSSVFSGIETLSAKRAKWIDGMTDDRTAQLMKLMQRPVEGPDLAADFQALYEQAKGEPAPSARPGGLKTPPAAVEGSRPGK